ncbi:hypothetical protein L2E82_30568 [Cichorium intybus]|uniref:Uncharacterized protein n=1 Tax=Cichorium intybus TaxID=13427 RepID=A0ACB9D0Q7_CICIN|nr:hypothetical protein L2E82_30568 [Cichorium intybus]
MPPAPSPSSTSLGPPASPPSDALAPFSIAMVDVAFAWLETRRCRRRRLRSFRLQFRKALPGSPLIPVLKFSDLPRSCFEVLRSHTSDFKFSDWV